MSGRPTCPASKRGRGSSARRWGARLRGLVRRGLESWRMGLGLRRHPPEAPPATLRGPTHMVKARKQTPKPVEGKKPMSGVHFTERRSTFGAEVQALRDLRMRKVCRREAFRLGAEAHSISAETVAEKTKSTSPSASSPYPNSSWELPGIGFG